MENAEKKPIKGYKDLEVYQEGQVQTHLVTSHPASNPVLHRHPTSSDQLL